MLLHNIGRIVHDNYDSLVAEAWGRGRPAQAYVGTVFIVLPIVAGVFFGLFSPLWTEFVGALVSVIGVLTGFSINSIVLLTGHSEADSYDLKTRVVNQTKDYTLYSILVGIILLVVLILGYIIANSDPIPIIENPYHNTVSDVQIASMLIYSFLIHYFLILLVITHRLYSLVHGNAIGNNP